MAWIGWFGLVSSNSLSAGEGVREASARRREEPWWNGDAATVGMRCIYQTTADILQNAGLMRWLYCVDHSRFCAVDAMQ